MNLKPMTSADYEAFVALHNRTYPRRTRTVDEVLQADAARDSKRAFGQWAAFDGDGLVGYARYGQWSGKTYENWVQVNVVVDEPFRRQGIGADLHKRVLDDVMQHPLQVLRADAYEDLPAGLPFAEHLGYSDVFREGPSHLDLDAFDCEAFAPLLRRIENEGVELVSYAALRERDPGFANALYVVCRDAWRDVPKEEETDLLREDWDADFAEDPGIDFGISTAALESGRIIGFCEVWSAPQGRPVYAGSAGVDRAERGRGIATAAYVRAIESARAKGHPQMQTSSAISNIAMQTVYAKLGFVREPVWIQLEKRLM